MKRVALAVAVALAGALSLASLAGGCDKKAPQFSGIGRWRFTTTTLANVKDGVCQPTDLSDGRKATWCFMQPPVKIGERVADVDLYFNGTTPEAKLIEIQLKVRGCIEADLEQWMRGNFGAPIETKSTRAYWKNSFLWAAALLPSEPARCVVHFLPLTENAEIERIKLL